MNIDEEEKIDCTCRLHEYFIVLLSSASSDNDIHLYYRWHCYTHIHFVSIVAIVGVGNIVAGW